MLVFLCTLLVVLASLLFSGKSVTPPNGHHKPVLPPTGPFEASKEPIVFKDPKEIDSSQEELEEHVQVVVDKKEQLNFPSNGKILCSFNYEFGIIDSLEIKAKTGEVKIEKQSGGAKSYSFITLRVQGTDIYVWIMGEKKGQSYSKNKGFSCKHAQTRSGS